METQTGQITKFKEQFRQAFDNAYKIGDATITTHELIPLVDLYRDVKANTFPSIPFKKLTPDQKEQLRDLVTQNIIDNGWPQPPRESIGPKALGISAAAHSCVVAESLIDKRGPEAAPDTVWSYSTKNQFDRFVMMRLLKTGRIKPNGDLHKDWYDPQNRDPNHKNKDVKYPEGIDDSKIYGVAKPNRFLPAQFLRFLEAIRLGKMPKEKMQNLNIETDHLEKYKIPWREFNDVIDKARTVDDIASGIAIRSMEIFKQRGLSNKQIIKLITLGYNPQGPFREHGNIPDVHHIWSRILEKVQKSETIAALYPDLETRAKQLFNEAGYPLIID